MKSLVLTAALLAFSAVSPVSEGEEPGLKLAEAESLLARDRFEDALATAREAAKAWPDHAPAHVTLADALYRRGDFVEAEEAYRRAVALDGENAAGHFGVGRILRTLGRYGDAAASFQEAARLAPSSLKYQRVLSNHLARREDVLVVLHHYLGMAKLRPDEEPQGIVSNVASYVALLELMGDAPLNEWVRREPAELPLSVVRGQAYLKLRIGTAKGQRFVFDTGATGLTISPRLAKRAGLRPVLPSTPFTISGTGSRKTEEGTLTLVPELALSEGIVLRNIPATIREPLGPEEGLIGPSLFSAYDISLDLAKGRLKLSEPGSPVTGVTAPFRNVGGQIVIRAHVNKVELNSMVDTGAAVTIVGLSTLARIPGLRTQPKAWHDGGTTLGTGGALADRRVLMDGALGLAGVERTMAGFISGNLSAFSRSLESEVYVILGVPQIAAHPFTIDYRRMTVTFHGVSAGSSR